MKEEGGNKNHHGSIKQATHKTQAYKRGGQE
jgi:hypothetical protein